MDGLFLVLLVLSCIDSLAAVQLLFMHSKLYCTVLYCFSSHLLLSPAAANRLSSCDLLMRTTELIASVCVCLAAAAALFLSLSNVSRLTK